MILYLHGFLSSPASGKARQLRAALAQAGREADFLCPPLPVSPRAAAEVALASAQLEDPGQLYLVGSSLGGYYATWIAERLGCRAVLLNPAIRPYEHLRAQLGWRSAYGSGLPVEVRPEYLDELRALETPGLTDPARYLLIAATGDEVIDYREMVEKYLGCPTHLIEGSDHALTDFARYLPEVLGFCGVSPSTRGGERGPS
ncbi:Esterase YqiA [Burkholderiales bacterium]|nr:Esterase YqiA [Burkholderiales bacterium]